MTAASTAHPSTFVSDLIALVKPQDSGDLMRDVSRQGDVLTDCRRLRDDEPVHGYFFRLATTAIQSPLCCTFVKSKPCAS